MIANEELIKSIKGHISHHKIDDIQSGRHRILLEALNKSIQLLETDTAKPAKIIIYEDEQIALCPKCDSVLFDEPHCPHCGQRILYLESEVQSNG